LVAVSDRRTGHISIDTHQASITPTSHFSVLSPHSSLLTPLHPSSSLLQPGPRRHPRRQLESHPPRPIKLSSRRIAPLAQLKPNPTGPIHITLGSLTPTTSIATARSSTRLRQQLASASPSPPRPTDFSWIPIPLHTTTRPQSHSNALTRHTTRNTQLVAPNRTQHHTHHARDVRRSVARASRSRRDGRGVLQARGEWVERCDLCPYAVSGR
jgi:hypothetical protein